MTKTQIAQREKLHAAEKALRKAQADLHKAVTAIYKPGTQVGVFVKTGQKEPTQATVVAVVGPNHPGEVNVSLNTAKATSRLAVRTVHFSKAAPLAWAKTAAKGK